MRNLFYLMLLFITTGITTACSSDMADQSLVTNGKTLKKPLLSPQGANTSNPFDYSGQAYLDLLDSYDNYDPKPESPSAIIGVLEAIGGDLAILEGYIPQSVQSITAVQQLSSTDIAATLQQSGLSSEAQNLLLGCINGLLELKEQDADYEEAYVYLVSYETSVLQSSLAAAEKEILLSTLSIVRYGIYNTSARKRKDRDWELSVGNFMATAYGAVQSIPNAVIAASLTEMK